MGKSPCGYLLKPSKTRERFSAFRTGDVGQGTVNAKITAPDFAAALEIGRKKPALSGRAKSTMGSRHHR